MDQILPIQNSTNVMSTVDLDNRQTSLYINVHNDFHTASGRLMVDDGITYTDPDRLDIQFEFAMKDNSHGTLTFNTKSSGFKSEATKLSEIRFLGADLTYVYGLTHAHVDGQTEVVGKYADKVLTFDFKGADMNTIQVIEFTKK